MRRTSGQFAVMAAIGGGLIPEADTPTGGHDQGDGTFRTRCVHQDGREVVITTRDGDGWQAGPVVDIVAAGPWNPMPPGKGRSFRDVRAWLAAHEPGREEPYCGGDPIRQPRPLDGREREILYRIIRDIHFAIRDGRQDELLRVIDLEQCEVYRLHEIRAVLDARND